MVFSAVNHLVLVQSNAEGPWSDIFIWSAILIGLVMVGSVLAVIARRNLSKKETKQAEGFTLHELRQLHAEGRISDEEFENAREALISSVKPVDSADNTDPAVLAVKQLRNRADNNVASKENEGTLSIEEIGDTEQNPPPT